jgi:hypothetical protein
LLALAFFVVVIADACAAALFALAFFALFAPSFFAVVLADA